ncbi:TIGR03885 family FMN-dependent LLM class oxidoreductase [Ancylobacter sp. WKF20]|uniref:TIGR03885 family FMN-dependent LLM class oxidoreductase n=1 Tax=Ancylobacter sp. WKF20 TaxID=3039801 RepID=UPI002434103F|nr:TIGR03885 family FMN-dependent LLM class oxidoreductase [Ancylobacter sp. WKF20]WGD30493.1 TIGR03885 family FMN-dependent LLM class oxidoreductase [Ancylobacter sp. WKF20]
MALGYHASHEQFAPSELLACVIAAEQAGFAAAMCSDHVQPWSERQPHSGFAWSWLGAALSATALPFGVVTTPIGLRYHPVIIAQAAATLGEMFPDRFWMALGSGEALNERVTGARWPAKPERDARIIEAAEAIRALQLGETVTRNGHIIFEEARLHTLPPRPTPLVGAALTPATARRAGGWADALVTINQPHDRLRAILDAFREGGGEGKPAYLQVHLSYAPTLAEARANAHDQWRFNALSSSVAAELKTPAQFDDATRHVRPEDLEESIRISPDPARHVDWIGAYAQLGFRDIYLHNVGLNQRAFIDDFGAKVLPHFPSAA